MKPQMRGSRTAPDRGRTSARGWLPVALVVLAGAAGRSWAEPARSPPAQARASGTWTLAGVPGVRVAIDTPRASAVTSHATVSKTLFLERCRGTCTVQAGGNDARNSMSSIPATSSQHPDASFTVHAFAGASGSTADADWTAVLRCIQEVYSPFGVTVTDVKPTSGTYHQAVIAGTPQDIGLAGDILGVAPLASDCSPIDNVMSFTFANNHVATSSDAAAIKARQLSICWTAAQESAHAYGLDHEYSFVTGNAANGNSACNDPMTYRDDCGGQKFFRNEIANCGEVSTRMCKCTQTQNSHQKLLAVFGPGTPITSAPTVQLGSPTAGGALGSTVALRAGAQRGVAHVDLYFNGYKWVEQPGAAFQKTGQLNPSSYMIDVPADLPSSVVDVQAVAYDDLEIRTESSVVTVTKGAACTSASTCATGQKCETGRCFWDPPVGDLGDSCTYRQFCKSGLCAGAAGDQICSQSCTPGAADDCPDGFACAISGAASRTCVLSDSGGCCSAGGDGPWPQAGLAAVVLGAIARRRRR